MSSIEDYIILLHEKNSFADISTNLVSENNLVELLKYLCRTFKLIARISELFAHIRVSLYKYLYLTKLFLDL